MKKTNRASSSKFRLPVLLLIFFTAIISQAQDSIYKERQENRHSIVIASGEGNFSLSFKDKDILETRFLQHADRSDSLVVHMGNGDQDLKLNISKVADSLSLSSEGIEILIKKEPFGITYNFQQLWIDFSTGKRHLPGSRVTVKSKDDIIPMLVRSGAIFPVLEEEKYGEPHKHLQLHYVFSSEVKKKQKDTCTYQIYGSNCYDIQIEAGNSLDITIKRESLPLGERGEEKDLEEVDFVVHLINRSAAFIWVNGIKYTGKNYMHKGKLVVPLNFREDCTELKIDWQ